ncbi:hypothetical protein NKG94_16845 [Micromonospora sp. M12]
MTSTDRRPAVPSPPPTLKSRPRTPARSVLARSRTSTWTFAGMLAPEMLC